jgi:hypothetical protein
MKKKQLAELVRILKKMRESSQTEVANALRRDDRLMVEYHRGGLDAYRDAIQLIEASNNG